MKDVSEMGLNSSMQPNASLPATRPEIIDETKFRNFYRVPPGYIDYYNLSKDSRFATAVVSLSGERGTFKDIQAAIAYVNSLGGGTVFIKAGTYFITSQITVFSKINIIGDGIDSSILDLTNYSTNDSCFIIRGSQISTAGSITMTNGSQSVSGSSTTFLDDNVTAGDFIYTKNSRFEVESVANNTTLTLKRAFYGKTITGSGDFVIGRPVENIAIEDVSFVNMNVSDSSDAPIDLDYADNINISNVLFSNNETNLSVSNTYNTRVTGCIFSENSVDTRDSVSIGGSLLVSGVFFTDCLFNNNSGYGLSVGFEEGVAVSNCIFSNNKGGINLNLNRNCTVNGCLFINNNNAGILVSGASSNIVSSSEFIGNGTAVSFTNSNAQYNTFIGNRFDTASDILILGSASKDSLVVGNSFFSQSGFQNLSTTNTNIVRANFNYSDEWYDFGTTSIASGTTNKTVTFNYTGGTGALGTPDLVTVTPSSTMGSASYWYVNAIGTTTFSLNLNTDPGTTVTFSWRVDNKKP